jgi:hypothetical protein
MSAALNQAFVMFSALLRNLTKSGVMQQQAKTHSGPNLG